MSRISEDALKRGLEAANLRIASLEKQLVEAKKVVLAKPETRDGVEEEAEKMMVPMVGKKTIKKTTED